MTHVAFAIGIALGVVGVACVVEPIDLNDRKCDEDRPCVDGYTCTDNICERDEADSSTSG
jgi:hypothetical protein